MCVVNIFLVETENAVTLLIIIYITIRHSSVLAPCKSVRSLVRWVFGSILQGGPIELFLVPASATRLV